MVSPAYFSVMISNRTNKKVLRGKYIKANPDALDEIKKLVRKGKYPSENNAINLAIEEKFLPKIMTEK